MNKKRREYLLYLNDMLQSMQKIQTFIEDCSFKDFGQEVKTQDAGIRNFEIIGEAANQIPKTIRERYNKIPWSKMYGLRNIVSHHYLGIDYSLIWKIAIQQLPQNQRDLKKVIEKNN